MLPFCVEANDIGIAPQAEKELVYLKDGKPPLDKIKRFFNGLNQENVEDIIEENRLTAAGLTLILGPFAVHRLYLGTSVKVPIVYSLTFGGFFVLPAVDFFVILLSNDFQRLKNDGRVFMWAKKKED